MPKRTVSAIVLNYRTPQLTVRCVQSLLQQSNVDQLEVVIVDNHSNDDSMGILRHQLGWREGVRLIEAHRNDGFGAGNNFGAAFANGEYILIVNPDCQLPKATLEQLISVLDSDHSIGIVAPRLMYQNGVVRPSARAWPRWIDLFWKRTIMSQWFPSRLQQYLTYPQQDHRPHAVDWVVGGFLLMRRSLYEQLNGFDEQFFLFFEDTDLCRRAKALGFSTVYAPHITVFDGQQRLSEGGLWSLLTKKTARIHVLSALKYFGKYVK